MTAYILLILGGCIGFALALIFVGMQKRVYRADVAELQSLANGFGSSASEARR